MKRIVTILTISLVFGLLIYSCKSASQTVPPIHDRKPYTVPVQIDDGWQTASLRDVGLDERLMRNLSAKIAKQEFTNIHCVIVVKNGYLVFEEYFNGHDFRSGRPLGLIAFGPDTLHDLRSVTKSVTSALVGIAVGEGKIPGVDLPIFDMLPEYGELATSSKRQITLYHALTMTAGLDWDESSVSYRDLRNSETAMARSADPVKYVLGRSVAAEPGTVFTYNGGLTTLLGAIVQQTTGYPIDEYAGNSLFKELGIENFEWTKYRVGMPVTASGLRLRPRDMAKFGYLYLNEGRWYDKQVISQKWIAVSLEPHVEIKKHLAYGFQWWIDYIGLPNGKLEFYEASGNGGQRIYIVPSLDLLVVLTAGNYDVRDRDTRFEPWRILVEYILPAAGVNFH